jgi:hypothetical protein
VQASLVESALIRLIDSRAVSSCLELESGNNSSQLNCAARTGAGSLIVRSIVELMGQSDCN